ncbi:MAG TPA: NAD(P)/FAD-dependent oxidoreductase [Fimbriimonadaceae bacterium]|nr:NAD(P)/FAD-dependent oxidoreductase [Fimbriimonadaceae bacterium]HRJ33785.1 NAD(P)/FAD-dependent oxidoreductase [Fimbriimonadaceae bacterium]
MAKPIVVVGAGLAGLACARELTHQGHEVIVLDSADRPGGRLKTDDIGGYRMDRGFQVHFTAYPAALQVLDSQALDLRLFAHGALIWWNGKLHRLDRDDPVEAAFCRAFGLGDKLRVRSLSAELAEMSHDDIEHEPETSSEVFLRRYGFTDAFMERFARPFWGGVFLDRSLSTSSRRLKFLWKIMNTGEIALPARGMEALPLQLADQLPEGSLRLHSRVQELVRNGSAVTGVRLTLGETLEAEQTIVATDPATSTQLTGVPTPKGSLGTTCLYFEIPKPVCYGNFIILNGTGKGLINQIVPVTNLCPEAAPEGKMMVSVNLIGVPEFSDSRLMMEIRQELATWPAEWETHQWRLLQIYRVPHAQYPQPPGVQSQIASSDSGRPGLILAGEAASQSSIQGALASGMAAALHVLQPQRELTTA